MVLEHGKHPRLLSLILGVTFDPRSDDRIHVILIDQLSELGIVPLLGDQLAFKPHIKPPLLHRQVVVITLVVCDVVHELQGIQQDVLLTLPKLRALHHVLLSCLFDLLDLPQMDPLLQFVQLRAYFR